ncbi:hypothetical protein LSUE1_G007607, partial [Lachnellula suecica]
DVLRDIGLALLPKDREARKRHCEEMVVCLSCVQTLLVGLPREFNYMVKYSIAALGEVFNGTVNLWLQHVQLPQIFRRIWSTGFLDEGARAEMREHGWCPSDIVRVQAKYNSIQTLYIMQMLDKSRPERDHSRCTEKSCSSYQINMGDYQRKHQHGDCTCEELVVNDGDLTGILLKDGKYPMLRFKGDMRNLDYEIVESSPNTPYVAISHVWADGLGNPIANSLHRCKIYHLQGLVKAVLENDIENGRRTDDNPLIWLDTLCCPAQDGTGKRIAIEKIRLVYRQAQHVLVLDAGLMSYESKSQEWPELLARIFTSSWMRRLWTLQEGALAKSLWFQFSDQALSFTQLGNQAMALSKGSVRHSLVLGDFVKEFISLASFFLPSASSPPGDDPELSTLDQALMFRSVSVSTDEPLCIGTLMSLDLHEILQVEPKEQRMQRVWELIALKKGGIPADIIFLEDERLEAPGWRWAPKSLLPVGKALQTPATRLLRWNGSQMGGISPRGLCVRYPGYRLVKRDGYTDGKPLNPWPGMPRLPEDWLQFRDVETGRWFRIADNKLAVLTMSWTTEEERREYHALGLFPLQHVADTAKSVLVLNARDNEKEAVFATVIGEEGGISVKSERQVVVKELGREEGYIYDVVERLALRLRRDEVTDLHLKIYDRLMGDCADGDNLKEKLAEDESFQGSLKSLREKMKSMLREATEGDPRLVAAITAYWGGTFTEHLPNTQIIEHGPSHEREPCRQNTPQERISRDSACGVEPISIHQKINALLKNNVEARANEACCEDRRHPQDGGLGSPAEPEKSDCEEEATDGHGRETGFWNGLPVRGVGDPGVPGLVCEVDDDGAKDAYEEG